jgi:hypothetical protein
MPALGKSSEKAPGKIRSAIGKVRKKFLPTFGEQFSKARSEGKKTFRSTRDDKKKGKLEYATTTKKESKKALEKTKRLDPKTGTKRIRKEGDKYEKTTGTKLSSFGSAFSAAKKAGKKEFTYKGKKYHTRVKGEKEKKPLISGKGFWGKKINISKPELSGKTSKKIKRFVGAKGGGRIAGAARRAQQHGWYSPDMGMKGRRMYAKGGLIKGKPKLAVKGW